MILVILLLNVNIVEKICSIKKGWENLNMQLIQNLQFVSGKGNVRLSLLKTLPKLLQELLFNNESSDSKKFQQHIRTYNMMFVFTSPGANFDQRFNNGRGPPNMRIQSQPCHIIGSLLSMPG